MIYIYLFAIISNLLVLVQGNGERYDLETYKIMQILRPVGSSMRNGTNTNSPVRLFTNKSLIHYKLIITSMSSKGYL